MLSMKNDLILVEYCNSDWASYPLTRRYMMKFVVDSVENKL